MDWHGLLALFLWISPHAFLGVVAVILCKRRLHREFPCFFAYVLYEIAEFILLFTLRSAPSVTGAEYGYAYYATLMISVALRFGVIGETSKHLFRESPSLKVAMRRTLLWVQGLLVVVAILLAIYAPGGNGVRWIAGVSVVNRGAAMVQAGLLLCLLLFSRFLGVSWSRPAFGIALGLGVLTSVDLAIYGLRAEFTTDVLVPYLDLLRTGTYFVCILIWIGYSLASEHEPASVTAIPHDEVETWNTELRRLLRD
jgi:hypothetical protein